MNTKTAATAAHVTPRAIQAWARYGAVAATKANGRWDIDENSLTRRIAHSRPRTATAEIRTDNAGRYLALGNGADLKRALCDKLPVHITTGPCAGDTVRLGLRGTTYGDYGVTPETVGLVRSFASSRAAYAIDTANLDAAPRLAAILDAAEAEADRREIEMAAADRAYLHPDYE